jgi:P-type Cu+ transporter
MVEKTKCDHCGAEANYVIQKEFDGKLMNFCCKGCLGVYEMLREEGLQNQDKKPDEKGSGN